MGKVLALTALPHAAHDRVEVGRLNPPQARLVLTFLALERARGVPRNEVADLLWTKSRPTAWDAALRGLALRARAFLAEQGLPGHCLRTERGCYVLALPPEVSVDVELAGRDLDVAHEALAAGDARSALDHARRGGAVFAAPFLHPLDHEWVRSRREAHRANVARSLEIASAAHTAIGQHAQAVAAAAEAHRLLPLRESALRALMTAHRRSGNRAEALEAFHRARRQLRHQLGVDPSAQSEALFLEILREEAHSAPAAGTAAPANGAAEQELQVLREQLGDSAAPASPARGRDFVRLCTLARRAGSAAEAETAAAGAAAVARVLGDWRLLADAALALASYDRLDVTPGGSGLALVEEALAALARAESGPAAGIALAERRTALLSRRVQYLATSFDGRAAARSAAELADELPLPSARSRAWSLAARLHGAGDPQARAALGQELFELTRGTEPELALFGVEQRAQGLAGSGDVDAAYAAMDVYARLAEQEGVPWARLQALQHKAFRSAAEGRFAECDTLADQLVRCAAVIAPAAVVDAVRLGALLVPHWMTGRTSELLGPVRLVGTWLDAPGIRAVAAFLHAEAGEAEAGRVSLRRLTGDDGPEPRTYGRLWALAAFGLVGATVRLEERDAADRLYHALLPLADDTCVHGGLIFLGSYQLMLGRLATTLGRWADAAEHLEAAVDRHRRMRVTPWVALAAEALAHALDEGGRRPPGARSRALRAEATALAAGVGMRAPAALLGNVARRRLTAPRGASVDLVRTVPRRLASFAT